jgi:flap endonuclease-1
LEEVVATIEKDPKKKYTIPDDWPYKEARELFFNPDVRPADDEACNFTWDAPDVEGLVKYLVGEKGFSEDRVRNGAQKLQKNLKISQQARLEGFFKPMEKTEEQKASLKRKHDEKMAEEKKRKKENNKVKKDAKGKPKVSA